jgi:hypothetical protein
MSIVVAVRDNHGNILSVTIPETGSTFSYARKISTREDENNLERLSHEWCLENDSNPFDYDIEYPEHSMADLVASLVAMNEAEEYRKRKSNERRKEEFLRQLAMDGLLDNSTQE